MFRIDFFFLSFIFLAASCNTPEAEIQPKEKLIPVRITSPEKEDITFTIEAIGTLLPSVSVEIRPQISGLLEEVFVQEGESVKVGAPLFRIDCRGPLVKQEELQAALAINQAEMEGILKKQKRYAPLVAKELISQTEWEELEAGLAKAKSTVDLNAARLKANEIEINHCMIASPIEGRIGKINVHRGNLLTQSQSNPLTTITTIDPLLVEFKIPEKDYELLPKTPLIAHLSSLCTKKACQRASITFIDHQFDVKTGQILIHATVNNENFNLHSGQSVTVKVPVSIAKDCITVPQKAIRYNQEGPYVYLVGENKTVTLRQIILGEEYKKKQIVLEGLAPSDQIILEGHLKLFSGAKVDIQT